MSERRYASRNALGSAIYQYTPPPQKKIHELQCIQSLNKSVNQLKLCMSNKGEYFEGNHSKK